MNIDKQVTNLSDRILENMPQNLTTIEKARYIYLELGKIVSFDEKYWYGTSKEKSKIYKSSLSVKNLQDLNGKKIICTSLSRIYNGLLERVGIGAVTYKEKFNDKHVYSLICVDGKIFKADLQKDLKYLQTRMKTRNFGKDVNDETVIEDEEIEAADKKLGYFYDGENFVNKMREELPNKLILLKTTEEKIERIFSEIKNSGFVDNAGYVEKMSYYDWLVEGVLDMAEPRIITTTDLRQENDDSKYTQCMSVLDIDGTYKRYIFSKKHDQFIKIEDAELEELMRNGLIPSGKGKIPGLNKKRTNKER